MLKRRLNEIKAFKSEINELNSKIEENLKI